MFSKFITLTLLIAATSAYADSEVERVLCGENNSSNNIQWLLVADQGDIYNFYVDVRKIDRATCGSRWGCDGYWQNVYEEQTQIRLNPGVALVFKGKRNTLKIDLRQLNQYKEYDAILSYPVRDFDGAWEIATRFLSCSVHSFK